MRKLRFIHSLIEYLRGSVLCALIASLSACADGSCDHTNSGLGVNGSMGETPTIKGNISRWGNMSGYTLEARLQPPDILLSTAPISASGEFSVTLPGGDIVNSMIAETDYSQYQNLFGDNCSGCIYTSLQHYRYSRIVFVAKKGDSVYSIGYGLSGPPAPPYRVVNFVYTDRAVSNNGTIICHQADRTLRWDKDYKFESGWNSVLTIADGNAVEPNNLSYTTPPPPDVLWLSSQYAF